MFWAAGVQDLQLCSLVLLRALLLGLGCNPNLSEVSLDLSCCEVRPVVQETPGACTCTCSCLCWCSQLRSGGSQVLEGCIAEIPNISCLDISDNGETVPLVGTVAIGCSCSVAQVWTWI